MKKTFFRNILVILLVLLTASFAFAKGGKEKNAKAAVENTAVENRVASAQESASDSVKASQADGATSSAMDTSSPAAASSEKASSPLSVTGSGSGSASSSSVSKGESGTNPEISAFQSEWEDFVSRYEELTARLEMAYDKDDAIAYREAKKALHELQRPVLSKERSEKILASLADDDYENADWLYRYSEFYYPVLKFVNSSDNFNYSSTFTANPGSEIEVPMLKGPNGAMLFQGWALTENGEVAYREGDRIKMPVKDTTLYAVFSPNPDIKQGRHLDMTGLSVKGQDGNVLPKGRQADVVFDLKNTGSENLAGVEVKFESDDPLFVILTPTLSTRFLSVSEEASARFRVITKAAAGTSLKGTLTVSDSEGVLLSQDALFTVE